ncbi:MAG: hypothetical protein Q8922_08730 [Bacteroidota bacterium]|nr:hypothetical protein [Bacteroidota bacterium]MDP4234390.1 hypothetical protein [Bacteroidota bacterium]MDP4243323.1 hypothetical protein [Bacteroidota bacterium]MDP4288008.1 hypothetical protein [Bacteroidota bacterium]
MLEAASPEAASSQLSHATQIGHADSMVATSLAALIQPLASGPLIVTGDTSLRPLLDLLPQPVGICLPMFYIERLTATIRGKRTDTAHLYVSFTGAFLRPGNPTSKTFSLSANYGITLTDREYDGIAAGRDPYVRIEDEPSTSFWSRTLEPALVVIGAAVIVALFFLVRG